jgi:peptide-methionine (S)-S-oxide reductase
MKKLLFIFVTSFALFSCAHETNAVESKIEKAEAKDLSKLSTAYFASGCFWCVEAVFESVRGVEEAVSGYSGGEIENPTYRQVSSGRIKHAEAVKVYYDPEVVSYATLVDVFFNSHDPSTLNRQGPDAGPQYRSIAFYETAEEKAIIETKIAAILESGEYGRVTTQVIPFEVFYDAEDYHQDYEHNNPNNSYVQAVSIPRLNAFKAKMPEVLK